MGGGRRPAGDFPNPCCSSSDDASSSDDSQITELPSPQRDCDACLSAYSRARALLNSRESIRRYKPGDFIEDASRGDKYEIPETTTLLLIGGSGKSALISQLKRVFADIWDTSTIDTAAVPDDSSVVTDLFYLQEHMMLKDSTSICVFDTPGWSVSAEVNYGIVRKWMENGVSQGEMNFWCSDPIDANMEENNTSLSEECDFPLNKKRMVNYVILVLDATSILESIDTKDTRYLDIVYTTFNYSFLSFKGNKPAVSVTNGNKLSSIELSRVLNSIEELLGIPQCQVFNISGIDNHQTDINILNLLRYCLEKADRCLPLKHKDLQEKQGFMHLLWRPDSSFEVVMDICIACLCFLVLWNLAQTVWVFSS